jgi:DNA-directed RNA polymerase subunit H (RpoH/RPB5)
LIDPQEDGQHCLASIVRTIEDRDGKTADNPTRTELLCSIKDDESEEIEILSHIESDESEETSVLKFKRITAHEGPLIRTSPDWKGSSYNVMMEWENGESTSEPLTVIAATDPIICAIYAQDNDLLAISRR